VLQEHGSFVTLNSSSIEDTGIDSGEEVSAVQVYAAEGSWYAYPASPATTGGPSLYFLQDDKWKPYKENGHQGLGITPCWKHFSYQTVLFY
jgi:hypothetical protein